MTKQASPPAITRKEILAQGKAARSGKGNAGNPLIANGAAAPVDPNRVQGDPAQRLAEFEAAIDAATAIAEQSVRAAKARFAIEAGTALRQIRDQELFRITHDTFAAYVKQRWSIGPTRAWQLIEAAPAMLAAATIVDGPIVEAHAVILEPVITASGAHAARELYQGVLEEHGKATAGLLRDAVEKAGYARPKPPQRAPELPEQRPAVGGGRSRTALERLDDAHERLARVSAAVTRTALQDAAAQHEPHATRTVREITAELTAIAAALGLAIVPADSVGEPAADTK